MLSWSFHIGLPWAAGVTITALCLLAIARNMGALQSDQVQSPLLMKILDRMTNVGKLDELLAEKPSTEPVPIDRAALKEALTAEILGQDAVIDDVVQQVWVRFARTKRQQPIGVFMLAGPPGTGKTEFGKALGRALYGPEGFFQIDMTALGHSSAATSVFGVPPGYQGSDRTPSFMSHLMANPRTVVVLDEFEKADRDVQRRFLGAWEDGSIQDVTSGRRVSTRDAIFVLTTNAMEDEIAKLAESQVPDREEISDRCKAVLKTVFEGAVLSRIDYVFPFARLAPRPYAALVVTLIAKLAEAYDLECVRVDPEVLRDYVVTYNVPGSDTRALRRQLDRDLSNKMIGIKEGGGKRFSIEYEQDILVLRKV